jgi:virginiamycin B lyase
LMKQCGGCHGLLHIPWHRMPHRNEDGWRTAVNRMFEINRAQVPVVSPEAVSAADREAIIKYFADNFGEDTKPRDLKLDTLPLNEDDLAQAIYVQYQLPPAAQLPGGQTRRRGMHDIYPSRVSPTVWFGDTGTGSILGMDLRTLDYPARFREWVIPASADKSVVPHGIIEDRGLVYWAELAGTAIGELDPKTGTIHRYLSPSKGSLHTLRADSKGNVWYTSVYGASRVGRLDAQTKTMREWNPAPNYNNAHYYGLIVDAKDRVWAAGNTAHAIVGYDPQTDRWAAYPTPTPSSGPRRPTADSKGRIWFSEHLGDAIGMLDPATGEVREYKSPFHHGGEYECYADASDNIWLTLRSYDTLMKFDPKTEKYTYFPYPEIRASVPKIETDQQGTIWFADGTNLVNFKPTGNVPTRQTSLNLR